VVATLERIASTYGRPKRIRLDNGPEFISDGTLCANDNETNYPVKFRLRAT
jgi:hypothetical protein